MWIDRLGKVLRRGTPIRGLADCARAGVQTVRAVTGRLPGNRYADPRRVAEDFVGRSDPGRLVFLHLAKTAGSSVREYMASHYEPRRVLAPRDGDRLDDVPDKALARYHFIAGHVSWSFLSGFRVRPMVLVFLREPVDRVVSHYYFHRGLGLDAARTDSARRRIRAAQSMDFDRYLESDDPEAQRVRDNYQTRTLAGVPYGTSIADPPGVLEAAKANLASCEMIGLYERIPESLAMVRRVMGWTDAAALPRKNRTSNRPSPGQLAPHVARSIREWNRLDRALYEWTAREFERRRRGESVVFAIQSGS